jgi:hypothetical protein
MALDDTLFHFVPLYGLQPFLVKQKIEAISIFNAYSQAGSRSFLIKGPMHY